MRIGIIGFGRFGRLLARYLSEDFEVWVFDRKNKVKDAIPASLEEVCSKDVVIPCVPISQFENVLIRIKGLLRKDSLVIDVCSVKEHPVLLMQKILPKKVQILATHPMFGPDSASDSLKGRKIVLCRVRINNELYERIKSFLKEKGLTVIETTPEEHDKEIAKSLVLTHFIGRSLLEFGAAGLEIDTEGYRRLLKILETVKNDTWQLFEDMNHYNEYSGRVREDFIRSMNEINRRLKK